MYLLNVHRTHDIYFPLTCSASPKCAKMMLFTNKLFIRNLRQQKGQELQKDRRQWSFSNVLSVLRPWVKEDQSRVHFFCVIKDLILRHISGEAGAELLALVLRGGRRRRNNSWRWDLRKPERVMSDCPVKEFTNDSGSLCEVTKKLFKGKWLAAGFALYVAMYYNRRLAHICIYLNTYYKKKYTSMASSCIGNDTKPLIFRGRSSNHWTSWNDWNYWYGAWCGASPRGSFDDSKLGTFDFFCLARVVGGVIHGRWKQ